jgi:peptidoglycan-associated lipoprotein
MRDRVISIGNRIGRCAPRHPGAAMMVFALVALAGACSSPKRQPPPPRAPTPSTQTTQQGGFTGETITDTMPETTRVPELGTIYFDYDSSAVREDARRILRTNGQAIGNHSDWGTVTLEGHCDERGSEEYNLALGERRATAAKRYLVDLGIPASRIVTVSFGESSPAVQGHDESAWQWNRRVEFRITQ